MDFAVANFRPRVERRADPGNGRDGSGVPWNDAEVTIVLEESPRAVPLALSARWKRPIAKVQAFEDPLAELVPLLAASRARSVVLASLSSISVLNPAALYSLAAGAEGKVVKLSVGRTPIEMYVAGRQTIVGLLQACLDRRTERRPLRDSLFTDAILPAIDVLEEIPGEILFQNDLMELYRRNLWVAGNGSSESFLRIVSRLPELSEKAAESHIAEKGSARNSWLGSGVEVEGEVEDSILFPNVHVRKDAFVSRSIIMNGNRIGSGSAVTAALVFPFSAELPRAVANIGDNCSIGSRTSTVKNADFPDQIRDGLTVVGVDAEIPAGLRVEAGACIGPGVTASQLRRVKVVRRGTTVLRPVNTEPGAREETGKGRR